LSQRDVQTDPILDFFILCWPCISIYLY